MRRGSANFDHPECGAALLTVLLMVTVMAALSVAVIDDVRFAIRRTTNAGLQSQAQWYALGAEAFARRVIGGTPKAELVRVLGSGDGSKANRQYDIDGGWIHARVTDGGNCFNLNSVVVVDDQGRYHARPLGVTEYGNLLTALDFSDTDRNALTAALVDWIDSDSRPQPRGAEDYDYGGQTVPYRTGNTPLADVSELRAIKGYEAEVMARLKPFVCAQPNEALSVINLNSLRADQAVLLSMLVGPALRPYAAESLLAARPGGGYTSTNAFWVQAPFEGLTIDDAVRAQTALTTSYYALSAQVSFHEAYVALQSLFKADGKRLTLLRRQFGNMS